VPVRNYSDKLRSELGAVDNMLFLTDNLIAITYEEDTQIYVYNIASKFKLVDVLADHDANIQQLALSKEAAYIASAGDDNCVKFWNAAELFGNTLDFPDEIEEFERQKREAQEKKNIEMDQIDEDDDSIYSGSDDEEDIDELLESIKAEDAANGIDTQGKMTMVKFKQTDDDDDDDSEDDSNDDDDEKDNDNEEKKQIATVKPSIVKPMITKQALVGKKRKEITASSDEDDSDDSEDDDDDDDEDNEDAKPAADTKLSKTNDSDDEKPAKISDAALTTPSALAAMIAKKKSEALEKEPPSKKPKIRKRALNKEKDIFLEDFKTAYAGMYDEDDL